MPSDNDPFARSSEGQPRDLDEENRRSPNLIFRLKKLLVPTLLIAFFLLIANAWFFNAQKSQIQNECTRFQYLLPIYSQFLDDMRRSIEERQKVSSQAFFQIELGANEEIYFYADTFMTEVENILKEENMPLTKAMQTRADFVRAVQKTNACLR